MILTDIMLSAIMLIVITLRIINQSVIMLSVILVSVVVPTKKGVSIQIDFSIKMIFEFSAKLN
jgi:hypothetical protein